MFAKLRVVIVLIFLSGSIHGKKLRNPDTEGSRKRSCQVKVWRQVSRYSVMIGPGLWHLLVCGATVPKSVLVLEFTLQSVTLQTESYTVMCVNQSTDAKLWCAPPIKHYGRCKHYFKLSVEQDTSNWWKMQTQNLLKHITDSKNVRFQWALNQVSSAEATITIGK